MTIVAAARPPLTLTPGSPGYDTARRVWNGMVDKRPAAIVRCADPAQVAETVLRAREAGQPVSVRGGGHQIAGAAVVDGGVVIDLAGMRYADVDLHTATVRVGGGALLADLDRACGRYGVAVPAGVVSHTGVGGLALGGGIGWLSRSRGLTCDWLREATIITAAGDTLVASDNENPDLFWALRGGGGNFGVVTEFVFAVAPIAPVTYGIAIIALSDAANALDRLPEILCRAPRELEVLTKLQRFAGHDRDAAPDAPPVLTIEGVWAGAGDGAGQLADLMAAGDGDSQVWRRRHASVQSQQDHRFPHGRYYYLKPGHLRALDSVTGETMIEAMQSAPPGDQQIEVMQLGGAVTDVAEDATAFPHRDTRFALNVSSGWDDPSVSAMMSEWARSTHSALTRGGPRSAYVNFVDAAAGPSLDDIYGADKATRLRAIKRRFDPDAVFNAGVPIDLYGGS